MWESILLNAALHTPPTWLAPVDPPVSIVRSYDPPAHNWLPGHRGVDLRTTPGTSVGSAGTGRVSFAGMLAGRGVVVVDHGTLRTTYEPLQPGVSVGDLVRAGDPLGRVVEGSGHCGSGTCLHFGVRRGRDYVDPRLLMWGARPRLMPWAGYGSG